jgi:hypothetical protein
MSNKFIFKSNGHSYQIRRTEEDPLYNIHRLIKSSDTDSLITMIKHDKELVSQFDLWLALDAVTLLYNKSKTDHPKAREALILLLQSENFTLLAKNEHSIWQEFHLDYYDLRPQLAVFKSALIEHSPQNPHLHALQKCSWKWQSIDATRFTNDAHHFFDKIKNATATDLNNILHQKTKDSSLQQSKLRLQAYRRLRHDDPKNYWNLFKPKSHKLKTYKDRAAAALECAIINFESNAHEPYNYSDSQYTCSDYKILYDALHQGRLHNCVVANSGIVVQLADQGQGLQFTRTAACSTQTRMGLAPLQLYSAS